MIFDPDELISDRYALSKDVIRVELQPHDLLQAEALDAESGLVIRLRNGTRLFITLDRPQAEHLHYELGKILNPTTITVTPQSY